MTATTDGDGNTSHDGYDAAGRLISVTDTLGNTTAYTYDAAGNRASVTDPAGHVTRYTYDAGRRLLTQSSDVSSNGVTTTVAMTNTYTPLNELANRTDADGRTMSYSYDGGGQLTGVTDAAGGATTYTRDSRGNLTAQTNAGGNTTTFTFDGLNRPTGAVYPDGARTTATYDAASNVATTTDARGQTITYTYDSLNQPSTITYPDHTVAYAYYPGGQTKTITDTPNSTGAPSVSQYGIDAMGRVITATTPQGTITYTYDGAGNGASITTPGGTTTYSYDADNRISAVTDPRGQTTAYSYDANGNLDSKTLANGTATTYSYDALNRLTGQQTAASGGATLYQEQDTVDPAGLRTTVRQVDASGVATTITYGYDAAGRLDAERQVRGTTTVLDDRYSYDVVGNRTEKDGLGGARTTYQYNARDELVSLSGPGGAAAYTYDADGNQTGQTVGGVTTIYTYDSQNRLLTVGVQGGATEASYLYDALGNRVSAMDAQGHITGVLFDSQAGLAEVVRETPSNGAPTDYVYGLDRVSLTRGGATSDYLYDGHGNTEALIDAGTAATVQDTYRYDAYGGLLAQAGSVANSFLYDGQQFDAATGLYDLRARYMDPATGRFLSTDRLPGSPQDPTSLHRYLYARDNPVTYADPSGQESIAELSVSSAIVQYLIKSTTPLFSFLHGNADTFGEVFKTSAKLKELYEYTEKLKEANELPVVEAVSTLYGSTDTSGKSNPILTGVLKVSVCTLGHHLSELREGLLEYTCTKATTGLLPFLIDSDSIGLNLVAYALVKELQVVTAQYAVSLPNNGVFVNEDFNSFVGQVIRLDIGKLGRSEEGGVIGLATTAAALELAYYSLPVLIIDTLPEASTGAVMPPDFIPGKSAKGGGGHEGGSGGE